MKTIITQKIDGYDIIIGIGEAQIDPVATEPLAIEALKSTAEYKTVDDKKKSMFPLVQVAQQAYNNAKRAKNKDEKNKFVTEWRARLFQIKEMEDEIKTLFPALVEKKKELMIKHAIYFQPAQNEKIIDDIKSAEALEKLQQATTENKLLSADLEIIDDYRGRTFWKKISGSWIFQEINKIGESPQAGYIEDVELTEAQQSEIAAQLEAERIAKLKSAEKLAEKEVVISALISQASVMRNGLEIEGDSGALKKAQDWYNAELEKVEIKYA